MSYEATVSWRDRTKRRLVEAFGGSCGICGYNKCDKSLDFHHIDEEEKEFNLSARIKKWERLVKEAKKCVMLCANCHREVHAGVTKLPNDIKRFDRHYEEYRIPKEQKHCIDCNMEITDRANRCPPCHQTYCQAVERPSYEELLKEVKETSFAATGRKYKVSDNTIRKWIKKYEKSLYNIN
jgi:hypothetical protein